MLYAEVNYNLIFTVYTITFTCTESTPKEIFLFWINAEYLDQFEQIRKPLIPYTLTFVKIWSMQIIHRVLKYMHLHYIVNVCSAGIACTVHLCTTWARACLTSCPLLHHYGQYDLIHLWSIKASSTARMGWRRWVRWGGGGGYGPFPVMSAHPSQRDSSSALFCIITVFA